MREWRELSAGRLLAIRREVLRETEDSLERDLLCNAAVLAESLTEDGERVYPDGEAVLGALSCREMEALLRELLEGAGRSGGNPNFDWRRYQALRGGKA